MGKVLGSGDTLTWVAFHHTNKCKRNYTSIRRATFPYSGLQGLDTRRETTRCWTDHVFDEKIHPCAVCQGLGSYQFDSYLIGSYKLSKCRTNHCQDGRCRISPGDAASSTRQPASTSPFTLIINQCLAGEKGLPFNGFFSLPSFFLDGSQTRLLPYTFIERTCLFLPYINSLLFHHLPWKEITQSPSLHGCGYKNVFWLLLVSLRTW